MKHKKNGFFNFILSFMPGAAQMYMGFMKCGVSIMAVFFLSFLIPSVLSMSDVFILCAALIWFYSFFHARNLASYREEELQSVPDEYVWDTFLNGRTLSISSPAVRKWTAGILVFSGIALLWKNVFSLLCALMPDWVWSWMGPFVSRVPQVAAALLLIGIGVKMICGKKEELYGDGE